MKSKFVCVIIFNLFKLRSKLPCHTHTHTHKDKDVIKMEMPKSQNAMRGASIAIGGIVAFLQYLKSFQWVIDIARWIQDTGARIAEAAFSLAIIYVMVFTFGHLLLSWMPDTIVTLVNQIVMITFTILPELVMLPIILRTSDLFTMGWRTKDSKSYIWAAAYAILTILFIALTLILLLGLRGGIHENSTQNDGNIFVLRCFSGLFYTVLQRLWDSKGRNSYTARYEKMTVAINDLTLALSKSNKELSEVQIALSEMANNLALLEREKMALSIALAGKKISKKSDKDIAPTEIESSKDEAPININDIRERIKDEIIKHLASGNKNVNMKKVSAAAGVSYNTGRKYAESIIKEISQEMPAV